MKKTNHLLLSLLFSTSLWASDWEFGIGAYHADISGFNAFAASGNFNEQQTKNLTVPFIFAAKPIGDKFNLIFRYSYYDEIITNGSSSDSNIFNYTFTGGVYAQINVNYRLFESIKEGNLSLNYIFFNNDKWKFEAGPNLTASNISSDMYETYFGGEAGSNVLTERLGRKFITFSDTDYRFGAEARASLKLSKRTSLNLTYRFTSPSEKNIHLLGASIAFKF